MCVSNRFLSDVERQHGNSRGRQPRRVIGVKQMTDKRCFRARLPSEKRRKYLCMFCIVPRETETSDTCSRALFGAVRAFVESCLDG